MANSSGLLSTNCLRRPFGGVCFRMMLLSIGLFGTILGRGQSIEVMAGFVHGWGAELVSKDRVKPSAIGNGWQLSAAYHFGADTVTHMSLGVGWSTVFWDQKFRSVDWTGDWIYDKSGTMETRTGQVLLTPLLSVHLSKRVHILVGADLGLNVQANRHEKSSGTITWQGYSSHGGPPAGHIHVDSVYADMEQMNPFAFAPYVGLEGSFAKHWTIRGEGVPYSSKFATFRQVGPRPAYVRLMIGYRFFRSSARP